MSRKRFSESTNDQKSQKKSKLEENDDVWGEDLQDEMVEECIELATQMTQSYSQFESRQNPNQPFFTSTQVNIDSKKRQAIDENVTKDGEIAILRNQLKQLQLQLERERLDKFKIDNKKQNEWLSKINEITKAKENLHSELNFKGLEIMNLKHKLAELEKKTKNNERSLNQNVQIQRQKLISEHQVSPQSLLRSKSSSFAESSSKSPKNKVSASVQVDLASSSLANLQKCLEQISLNKTQHVSLDIPVSIFRSFGCESVPGFPTKAQLVHLKNQTYYQETRFKKHSSLTLLNSYENSVHTSSRTKYVLKDCCLTNQFFDDLIALFQCTERSDIDKCSNHIKNVFITTFEILFKFNELLFGFIEQKCFNKDLDVENQTFFYSFPANFYKDEQILQLPDLFDSKSIENENVILNITRCLLVLKSIMPYSEYVQKLIKNYSSKIFDPQLTNNIDFMTVFANILVNICKINSSQFSNLLSASLIFLKEFTAASNDEFSDNILKIVHQIIMSKPILSVLYHLIEFLHKNSTWIFLMESLCQNLTAKTNDVHQKKVCRMQVLILYIESAIFESDCAKVEIKILEKFFENILELFYNILNQKISWTLKSNENCKCIKKLYQAVIHLIYKITNDNQLKSHRNYLNLSVMLLNEIMVIRNVDIFDRNFQLNGKNCVILRTLTDISRTIDSNSSLKNQLDDLLSDLVVIKDEVHLFVKDQTDCLKIWTSSFRNFSNVLT